MAGFQPPDKADNANGNSGAPVSSSRRENRQIAASAARPVPAGTQTPTWATADSHQATLISYPMAALAFDVMDIPRGQLPVVERLLRGMESPAITPNRDGSPWIRRCAHWKRLADAIDSPRHADYNCGAPGLPTGHSSGRAVISHPARSTSAANCFRRSWRLSERLWQSCARAVRDE